MAVPAGEHGFAQGLKSQGAEGVSKGTLTQNCKAWTSNSSRPPRRKTLQRKCFACVIGITGGLTGTNSFLCVINIMNEAKWLLKLLQSHSWISAVRGRTWCGYMHVSTACFTRVWCPVLWGYATSFPSLMYGVVELLMSCCHGVFSLASCSVSGQVIALSSPWSSKLRCFWGG